MDARKGGGCKGTEQGMERMQTGHVVAVWIQDE
jgi:hypothetical protein